MIIISDIDGSLCRSIFANDGSQDQEDPAFQRQLLELPILPWLVHLPPVFQNATCVIFVTGRGVHLNNITATWITDRLGIHRFTIVNAGFTTYDQYIKDKEVMLAEAIAQSIKARASRGECIHLIEDDPAILAWLVDVVAPGLDGIIVHQVKNGIHSIAYPCPSRKR